MNFANQFISFNYNTTIFILQQSKIKLNMSSEKYANFFNYLCDNLHTIF